MFKLLISKIHVRSGALLVGAFFGITGVVMVFQGIAHEGFIDLNSAIVSGKVKSGLVSVTFAFLGALIVLGCAITKPTVQKLKVKKGESVIEWEGVINSTRALLAQIESMSIALESNQSANKAIQPTSAPLRSADSADG